MIIYAHRGNLNGPNPECENDPKYIQEALDSGYGVEVDFRKVGDCLHLGHDCSRYPISREFLVDKRILVHCKTVESFEYLSQFNNIHSFYQTNEDVVLSTWGKLIKHCDYQGWSKVENAKQNEIIINPKAHGHLGCDIKLKNPKAFGIVTDFAERLKTEIISKPLELLILDVDGVMTDGNKNYNMQHNCETKRFNDRDFTAIKRFKSDGIKVCFLTGDKFNIEMASKRDVKYFDARQFSDQLDKTKSLEHIKNYMNYSGGKIAYVGDDYYDLSLLNIVDYPFCPSDACEDLKSVCKVLKNKGGQGVVAELYEIFKNKLNRRYPFE